MKTSILLISALFASAALADDIKTIEGKEYLGVTISHVEPDGITVITDSGVEKILFTSLSKELQTKYGYDPQKAAIYSTQAAAAQLALAERNRQILVKIAHAQAAAGVETQHHEQANAQAAKAEDLHIQIDQVIPGGVLAYPMKMVYSGGPVASGMASIGGGGNVAHGGDGGSYEATGKTIFVEGVQGAAEGQEMGIKAYRDGTHTFGVRTVERWVLVITPIGSDAASQPQRYVSPLDRGAHR